jgi:hypothetical protein
LAHIIVLQTPHHSLHLLTVRRDLAISPDDVVDGPVYPSWMVGMQFINSDRFCQLGSGNQTAENRICEKILTVPQFGT